MLHPGLTSQKVLFFVKKYNSKHSKNTEINKIMIRNVTHFLDTSFSYRSNYMVLGSLSNIIVIEAF